ncbi:hypothetical protein BKA70DRAFT_1459995 [Coprinopsis sp. MPI-PUGE-AT-0042]|nr:hypothetical protein BKA70DRAFT_1459995 [Coprinopsis sp. MPI-PUGE-AT-0042]
MLPAAPLRGRLRTNYVPSETAALPKLIKAVEPRIASLDAGIEVMKQERDIYSSFVAENCSLISPICYTPPNVLRSIFSYCVPRDTLERIMHISEAPLLPTRICSHWRDLVIKTPTIWSTIFLKVPVLPPSSAHSMHILPCEMMAASERLSVDIEAKGASDALLAPLTNEWRRKMTRLGNLTTVPDRGYIKKPMDLLLSLLCARSSQWTRLDLRITGWSSSEVRFLGISPSKRPNLQSVLVRGSSQFGAIRTSAAQLVECLKLAVGLTELTINMSKFIPPPPDPLLLDRGMHEITPAPLFFRDELLASSTPTRSKLASEVVASPEAALCPKLARLELVLGDPSQITTKALKFQKPRPGTQRSQRPHQRSE